MIRQAILAIFAAGAIGLTPNATADEWQYTIRPGDELWTIARDFCGSANKAGDIADHNQLSNVAAIRAGQRITIPTAWLVFAPATATVLQASGDARIKQGTAPGDPEVNARPGDQLLMGHSVVTGEGAALIEFADQSQLAVQPRSRVLFNKLTAFGPAGMVDTHLRFAYGRGEARVRPQNRGDRFRIQTPQGVAAVRGTEFRVAHRLDDEASNSETLEGEVAFVRPEKTTDLPAGFGIAAGTQGIVKEQLLAAPRWLDNNDRTAEAAAISWQPLQEASHYIVSWTAAAQPEMVVQQSISRNNSTEVTVPPGQYQLHVRGVSSNGIEGFDASRELTVRAMAPRLLPISTSLAGPVDFKWDFTDSNNTFEMTLEADHLQSAELIKVSEASHHTELPAGKYRWRVQAEGSAPSQTQSFTLIPLPPTDLQIKRRNKVLFLSWQATDATQSVALQVVRTDGTERIEKTISGTSAEITVSNYGDYIVRLASVQNSLQSETLKHPVQVYKRPWWMSLLIPLIVL